MELRELRCFVALADELNFTRAATRVFVTQQALSRTVSALERRIGGTLVVRRARGCSLTPLGLRLAVSARALLSEADRLAETVASPASGSGRPLRVGLLLDGLGPLTAPVVNAFRACSPDGAVAVVRVHPEQVTPWLLAGRIDAAFTHGPTDPRLCATALFAERRVVVVSAAHALADAQTVDEVDLLTLPARTRRPDIDPVWEGVFTLVAERGDEQPRRFGDPVGCLEELLWSISVDQAFLTMPAHLADTYPAGNFGIRFVPAPGLHPVVFCMVHRPGEPDPRVRLLRDVAVAGVPGLASLLPAAVLEPQPEVVGH